MAQLGCSSDEKAFDIVAANTETGAILRTVAIDHLVYDLSNPTVPIQFMVQYDDEKNGKALDKITLTLSFTDRTPENGDFSKEARVFKEFALSDFDTTSDQVLMAFSLKTETLLEFLEVKANTISCTDKFTLNFEVCLKNGRCFTAANSTGAIISYGGFFNSPFPYDIYVVKNVDDNLFTGSYTHTSIKDGFGGPTIITPELLTIQTTSTNIRQFEIVRDLQLTVPGGVLFRADVAFVIACDQAILTKYVRSAIACAAVEGEHQVLLGPDENLAQSLDSADDSVFELRFLEAIEGNDGFCGWPLTSSVVRLSKQ